MRKQGSHSPEKRVQKLGAKMIGMEILDEFYRPNSTLVLSEFGGNWHRYLSCMVARVS